MKVALHDDRNIFKQLSLNWGNTTQYCYSKYHVPSEGIPPPLYSGTRTQSRSYIQPSNNVRKIPSPPRACWLWKLGIPPKNPELIIVLRIVAFTYCIHPLRCKYPSRNSELAFESCSAESCSADHRINLPNPNPECKVDGSSMTLLSTLNLFLAGVRVMNACV